MFPFIVISAALVAVDFYVKKWAVFLHASGKDLVLIPKFLVLTYVENSGAAFGLLTSAGWLLSIIAFAVCAAILIFINLDLCRSRLQYAALLFIFAGALGNLINRVMLGYVIDFIALPYWPVFNLADIFINIGVALYVIYTFRTSR